MSYSNLSAIPIRSTTQVFIRMDRDLNISYMESVIENKKQMVESIAKMYGTSTHIVRKYIYLKRNLSNIFKGIK